MARYHLIESYVAALRQRLSWRDDIEDLIAETEDHLLTAVEGLMADGVDRTTAQRAVLDRFGDPKTVAMAFAATTAGTLAVPTGMTKRAGVAGLAAAALWGIHAASWLVDGLLRPSLEMSYLSFVSLVGAAGLTLVFVLGLNRRHGGLGPLGGVGTALTGLGSVATVMFWFVMGWGTLFAVGLLLVALAVHSRGLAPARPTVAFGCAWVVGVVTWTILRVLEVGTPDRWGDYPAVSPIAVALAVATLLPGLVGLGRWLRGETPVTFDHPSPVANA